MLGCSRWRLFLLAASEVIRYLTVIILYEGFHNVRPAFCSVLLSTSYKAARPIFANGLDAAKSETPVRTRKSIPRNTGINLKLKGFQRKTSFTSDAIVSVWENRFAVGKSSVELQITQPAEILFLFFVSILSTLFYFVFMLLKYLTLCLARLRLRRFL